MSVPISLHAFKVQQYLRYLWQSGNAHRIQSPFVYELYSRYIRQPLPAVVKQELKEAFRQAVHNRDTFSPVDMGAGSQRHGGGDRSVRHLAATVRRPMRQYRLLYQLIQGLSPAHVLELGSALGFTSLVMAHAAPDCRKTIIEGDPFLAGYTSKQVEHCQHMHVMTGSFTDHMPQVIADHPADFILLDGHHTYEATMSYAHTLLEQPIDNLCIVLDDIRWSRGMWQAWQELCRHPAVTLHLDFHSVGVLLRRQGQAKEGWVLRY